MAPIVLIHGFSTEGRTDEDNPTVPAEEIARLYGRLPTLLRNRFGTDKVVEIDVTRYVSLEDGISVEDVSYGLDRALRAQPGLVENGRLRRFSAIVHSTGALVIRNWIRRYAAKPCEAARVIYLAGANFGSG